MQLRRSRYPYLDICAASTVTYLLVMLGGHLKPLSVDIILISYLDLLSCLPCTCLTTIAESEAATPLTLKAIVKVQTPSDSTKAISNTFQMFAQWSLCADTVLHWHATAHGVCSAAGQSIPLCHPCLQCVTLQVLAYGPAGKSSSAPCRLRGSMTGLFLGM